MVKRLLRVIFDVLSPLPSLGNWGPVVGAFALILGASWLVGARLGVGGADKVTGTWGIVAVLAVLSLLGVLATYRAQDHLDAIANATPILQFGDPLEDNNVIVDQTPGRMWRVPLENVRPGTQALSVRAKIYSVEPSLFSVSPSMHEAHDNKPPFRREWNVAYGQPIILDLISEDLYNPGLFYLFRGDGDMNTYSDMISGTQGQTLMGSAAAGGVKFTLRAVSDPPTRGIEQRYLLYQDMTVGELRMKKDGEAVILG